MIRLIPALLLLALPGCTLPVKLPGLCRTGTVGAWIGQPYSYRLERRLKDKTESRFVRVIRPDTMVTQDLREDRLNIALDARDRVTRLYCG
jgi:hypothetical protein